MDKQYLSYRLKNLCCLFRKINKRMEGIAWRRSRHNFVQNQLEASQLFAMQENRELTSVDQSIVELFKTYLVVWKITHLTP